MNTKSLLTAILMVASGIAAAQNANRAFAITGDGNKDFTWMNIRQVDLSTGQVTKTIFERSKTSFVLMNGDTKTSVVQSGTMGENLMASKNFPTSTLVAASAYDKSSNKLFFMPMRIGELRWMDVNIKNETPRFYSIQSEVLNFGKQNDEANQITRMVIAADGNGYALTNDGNHLIKFTTGRRPVVTDLGNVIDDASNNGISIHNKCTSWGGDMVADAFGKLYVITASRNVFVVDISARTATYKGTISGLPAAYTTNGAAVDADGDMVVSSATTFAGYYKVKLADLSATKIAGSDEKYNASDLANANLLLQKEYDDANRISIKTPPTRPMESTDSRIFPNPVTNGSFNVLLDGAKKGNYTIILTDLAGRTLQTNKVSVTKGIQTENIKLNRMAANGMYMIKVVDDKNKTIHTEKIMID